MQIIWHGHSCFELVEQDYHIVIDPFQPGSVGTAFPDLDLEADEVLVTHEHRDHNGRECVRLRTGRTSPFTVTELQGAHDFARGRLRGPNTIFLIEANGVRVAHFGDQGGPLLPDQKKALKNLDAAMIPTGGILVWEPDEAVRQCESLQPRVIIPMHYKAEGHSNWRLWPVEHFSSFFTENDVCPVNEIDGGEIEITSGTEKQVVIFKAPK